MVVCVRVVLLLHVAVLVLVLLTLDALKMAKGKLPLAAGANLPLQPKHVPE